MTLSGNQQPLRTEITEAAMKLGPEVSMHSAVVHSKIWYGIARNKHFYIELLFTSSSHNLMLHPLSCPQSKLGVCLLLVSGGIMTLLTPHEFENWLAIGLRPAYIGTWLKKVWQPYLNILRIVTSNIVKVMLPRRFLEWVVSIVK